MVHQALADRLFEKLGKSLSFLASRAGSPHGLSARFLIDIKRATVWPPFFFIKMFLRLHLLHRLDAAGADAHAFPLNRLHLKVDLMATLGRDVGVAAGLGAHWAAVAELADFRHRGGVRR